MRIFRGLVLFHPDHDAVCDASVKTVESICKDVDVVLVCALARFAV